MNKTGGDTIKGDSPVRKLPTRKLLGAVIAGALFLPHQAFTLGLGEIEVNSALNQKLKADIELLSAAPEEAEALIVKLASRQQFTRAGLDRPYALNDLRFTSNVIDGKPYISVSSLSPIREPFLNFLIEVDWPNGQLLREYTILLDPPVFMTQSATTTSAPPNQNSSTANDGFRPTASAGNIVPVAPSVGVSSRPAASQTQVSTAPAAPATQAATTTNFVPAPVSQQQATINQPPGAYRIKAGDTAWSLADAMRPDQSISVEQMMIAMLRANPESFIEENVNGLKRGYILRLPDYEQIAAVNQADAKALVREQAALWKQYQQSQAGGQPVSAMQADGESGSVSGSSGVDAETDEAYLEIVSAGGGMSTSSGKDPTQMTSAELRAELALSRERIETEKVEKEALQGRIDTLEQRVDKMKGMLSIEDNELADVQSLNRPVAENTMDTSGEMQAAEGIADSGSTDEAMSTDEQPVTTDEDTVSEEMAGDEVMSEEAVFADETTSEESAESAEGSELPVVEENNTDDVKPSPLVESEPTDPLSKLLNDPVTLAGIAGVLLLIFGVIGVIVKRRKNASATEASTSGGLVDLESLADQIASGPDDDVAKEAKAASEVASAEEGEAEFDSDSTMILDTPQDAAADSGGSAVIEEEEARDDVIAEADVYLAYGIYQQSEELLTQAIADNPERDDYRAKLAETHYASKNKDAFVKVASELKERIESEDSPAWKKVMVMGQDMCADDPMFQGSMVGDLDVDSLAPTAPEMDFDLGIDSPESAEGSTDLDLSLDSEPLDLPDDADSDDDHDATQLLDAAADAEENKVDDSSEALDELEFDLSDTGAVEADEAAEDEFSLDIEASELDIDINMTDDTAETKTDDDEEESIDLGDVDIGLDLDEEDATETEKADDGLDVGEVDLDFGLDDADTDEEVSLDLTDEVDAVDMGLDDADTDEEVSLDLTDEVDALDMDLDDAEDDSKEPEMPAAEVVEDDGDFDLGSLDDVDEVSTKLDLARAYLDMGDHEGSRGILEEVMAEGNDEQKKEAADLMEKLD